MQRYTVVVQFPGYINKDRDTIVVHIWGGDLKSIEHNGRVAAALQVSHVEEVAGGKGLDVGDFRILAIFAGHHDDLGLGL